MTAGPSPLTAGADRPDQVDGYRRAIIDLLGIRIVGYPFACPSGGASRCRLRIGGRWAIAGKYTLISSSQPSEPLALLPWTSCSAAGPLPRSSGSTPISGTTVANAA